MGIGSLTKKRKYNIPDSTKMVMTRSHRVFLFVKRRARPIVRRYCLDQSRDQPHFPQVHVSYPDPGDTTYQVLYEIRNVATPVVASVVQ